MENVLNRELFEALENWNPRKPARPGKTGYLSLNELRHRFAKTLPFESRLSISPTRNVKEGDESHSRRPRPLSAAHVSQRLAIVQPIRRRSEEGDIGIQAAQVDRKTAQEVRESYRQDFVFAENAPQSTTDVLVPSWRVRQHSASARLENGTIFREQPQESQEWIRFAARHEPGRYYFYNARTGDSQWEIPSEDMAPPQRTDILPMGQSKNLEKLRPASPEAARVRVTGTGGRPSAHADEPHLRPKTSGLAPSGRSRQPAPVLSQAEMHAQERNAADMHRRLALLKSESISSYVDRRRNFALEEAKRKKRLPTVVRPSSEGGARHRSRNVDKLRENDIELVGAVGIKIAKAPVGGNIVEDDVFVDDDDVIDEGVIRPNITPAPRNFDADKDLYRLDSKIAHPISPLVSVNGTGVISIDCSPRREKGFVESIRSIGKRSELQLSNHHLRNITSIDRSLEGKAEALGAGISNEEQPGMSFPILRVQSIERADGKHIHDHELNSHGKALFPCVSQAGPLSHAQDGDIVVGSIDDQEHPPNSTNTLTRSAPTTIDARNDCSPESQSQLRSEKQSLEKMARELVQWNATLRAKLEAAVLREKLLQQKLEEKSLQHQLNEVLIREQVLTEELLNDATLRTAITISGVVENTPKQQSKAALHISRAEHDDKIHSVVRPADPNFAASGNPSEFSTPHAKHRALGLDISISRSLEETDAPALKVQSLARQRRARKKVDGLRKQRDRLSANSNGLEAVNEIWQTSDELNLKLRSSTVATFVQPALSVRNVVSEEGNGTHILPERLSPRQSAEMMGRKAEPNNSYQPDSLTASAELLYLRQLTESHVHIDDNVKDGITRIHFCTEAAVEIEAAVIPFVIDEPRNVLGDAHQRPAGDVMCGPVNFAGSEPMTYAGSEGDNGRLNQEEIVDETHLDARRKLEKETRVLLDAEPRSAKKNIKKREVENSLEKIQALTRQKLAKKKVLELKDMHHVRLAAVALNDEAAAATTSAVKIQSMARQRSAKLCVTSKKEMLMLERNSYLAAKDKCDADESKAATRLQSLARKRLAKAQARQRRDMQRAKKKQKDLEAEIAATKVQGLIRHQSAKKQVAQLRSRQESEQRAQKQAAGEADALQWRREQLIRTEHEASLKLQGLARQNHARRKAHRTRRVRDEERAEAEASVARAHRARDADLAATTLQCLSRSKAARASSSEARRQRQDAAAEHHRATQSAAVRIQGATRRKAAQQHTAALRRDRAAKPQSPAALGSSPSAANQPARGGGSGGEGEDESSTEDGPQFGSLALSGVGREGADPVARAGALVEARYQGRLEWLPGVVDAVHRDGTLDVWYSDGDTEVGVPRLRVRLAGQREPLALAAGMRCEVLHGRRGFPGVVVAAAANGSSYTVELSDGDLDADVPRENIFVQCVGGRGGSGDDDLSDQDSSRWDQGSISLDSTVEVEQGAAAADNDNDDDDMDALHDDPDVRTDAAFDWPLDPVCVAGTRVEARFKGRLAWFPGCVRQVRAGPLLDLDYDDGDTEVGVPRLRVRLAGQREPLALAAGTRCEARYRGGAKCFPGVVVNGWRDGEHYMVEYDDGEKEERVPRGLIFALSVGDVSDVAAHAARASSPRDRDEPLFALLPGSGPRAISAASAVLDRGSPTGAAGSGAEAVGRAGDRARSAAAPRAAASAYADLDGSSDLLDLTLDSELPSLSAFASRAGVGLGGRGGDRSAQGPPAPLEPSPLGRPDALEAPLAFPGPYTPLKTPTSSQASTLTPLPARPPLLSLSGGGSWVGGAPPVTAFQTFEGYGDDFIDSSDSDSDSDTTSIQ